MSNLIEACETAMLTFKNFLFSWTKRMHPGSSSDLQAQVLWCSALNALPKARPCRVCFNIQSLL